MAQVEVLLPKMGESVAEATIIKWLKSEGESIEAEESLVEIATDKVDSEVPAPADGVILKILVQEGDVVNVGDPIAIIGSEGDSSPAAETPTTETTTSNVEASAPVMAASAVMESVSSAVDLSKNGPSGKFYSPLVRNIAKTEGIQMNELETISGTGQSGRVTKKDILAYLENRKDSTAAQPAVEVKAAATSASKPETKSSSTDNGGLTIKQPSVPSMEGDEIIEMDRMRKLIADHMVMSTHVSPHVTSYVEADVTNIVMWRNRVKDQFLAKEGQKITFTPIFMEAIVKAIKDFPMINVSVDGDKIIKRRDINIGMATALPSGNLIVPVIKNADNLNLTGITKSVNGLANKARNNKLSPDDIQGGTYTVTNVGTFGNVMGTPIINQPQVAILALGAVRKVPAVIETPQGDSIGIRHKMFLSHSYDHRVVDGALGGMFVRKVADYLEQFDINRDI